MLTSSQSLGSMPYLSPYTPRVGTEDGRGPQWPPQGAWVRLNDCFNPRRGSSLLESTAHCEGACPVRGFITPTWQGLASCPFHRQVKQGWTLESEARGLGSSPDSHILELGGLQILEPQRTPLCNRGHNSIYLIRLSWQLNDCLKKQHQGGTSLVAQWIGRGLPMQGTRVRSLAWEDSTCPCATAREAAAMISPGTMTTSSRHWSQLDKAHAKQRRPGAAETKQNSPRNFPGSPVVKTSHFPCRKHMGSIPGQGTKIPHAAWHGHPRTRKR